MRQLHQAVTFFLIYLLKAPQHRWQMKCNNELSRVLMDRRYGVLSAVLGAGAGEAGCSTGPPVLPWVLPTSRSTSSSASPVRTANSASPSWLAGAAGRVWCAPEAGLFCGLVVSVSSPAPAYTAAPG